MINLIFFKIKSSLLKILIIFSVITFSFSNYSIAQEDAKTTIKPDPRVFEMFEPVFFSRVIQNNPNLVLFYNFMLDSSYYFMELPKEKIQGLPKISQLTNVKSDYNGKTILFNDNIAEIIKNKKFNPLKYNIVFDNKVRKVYNLDNTNYVIVFLKLSELQEKFLKYKKQLNIN